MPRSSRSSLCVIRSGIKRCVVTRTANRKGKSLLLRERAKARNNKFSLLASGREKFLRARALAHPKNKFPCSKGLLPLAVCLIHAIPFFSGSGFLSRSLAGCVVVVVRPSGPPPLSPVACARAPRKRPTGRGPTGLAAL